jgi:hypothetical protein
MSKSIVFISHINPEKEVAIAFKELIEASFLGMIEVFVSSDEHSISMGQRWLENITNALKSCSIEIVLCSPQSIKRPWINFEAGAGWIRDIPVIPLCHSGMEPSKLPLPLNLLQAATANQVSSLNLIFPVLAHAIGSATPKVDFKDFIAKVAAFEHRYTFWDACNAAFAKLHALNADLIRTLRTGTQIELRLTESQIGKVEEFMQFLTQHRILAFRRTGDSFMTGHGQFYGCLLIPMEKLADTLNDSDFRI